MNLFSFIKCGLLISTASLFSCNQNSKEKMAFKEISNSLVSAADEMNRNSRLVMMGLEERRSDPLKKERTIQWGPKAFAIDESSKRAIKSIDSLKELLKEKYDPQLLQQALLVYKNYVTKAMQSGKEIEATFETEAAITHDPVNYHSPVMAGIFLDRLRLQASLLNTHILSYCFSQTSSVGGCGFASRPRAIVTQSSNVLLPGQSLEIFAGIGNFINALQPTIKINNKVIKTGWEDFASTKLKVPQQPGRYSVPVEIIYTNVDGVEQTKFVSIEYKVIKEPGN